ncbi:hypothetical protein [Mucilaginibacter gracilis]|nr:hypothetical protein [Mucilaginibacter gracilis]
MVGIALAGKYLFDKDIPFKTDRLGKIKQLVRKWLISILQVSFMFGNGYVVIVAEHAREMDILSNKKVTVSTTALVTDIVVTQGRSGSHLRAQIKYIANGKVILKETPNDDGRLKKGRTYILKYSTTYPEIFDIYRK